ncbi:hypothetical protein BHE74_00055693, partial [Ensete ventricosum]
MDAMKHLIVESAVDAYASEMPESFTFVDLGCSSGSNALPLIGDIIKAIHVMARRSAKPAPEFTVFLNDLPSNDFNSMFLSLPLFTKKLNEGIELHGGMAPSVYFAATPEQKLFLQVPPGLVDINGRPINKGNLYISNTSPPAVTLAYFEQFQKEFSIFLKSRSAELHLGGRMVVAMLGRTTDDHSDKSTRVLWEVLDQSFAIMISQTSFCTRPYFSCTITIISSPMSNCTFPTPSAADDGFYTCSSTATAHHLSVLCREGSVNSFSMSNDGKSPTTAGSTLSPHLPPLLFNGRCHPPLSSPLISAASCSPRCQQRRCPSLPPLLHSATASATPNADAAASSTRCCSHFQPTFFTAALFLCLLPQLSLLLDIGSHLTWVSCTSSYQCRSCSSPSAAPVIPFLPKSSSSTRLVSCHNPHCLRIHPRDRLSRCPSCNSTSADGCPAVPYPPYALIYGTSSTAGLLMLETLAFPHRTIPDFAIGCSILSEHQPAGVAGFGRALPPSLPSQMGLKCFSSLLCRGLLFLGHRSTATSSADEE